MCEVCSRGRSRGAHDEGGAAKSGSFLHVSIDRSPIFHSLHKPTVCMYNKGNNRKTEERAMKQEERRQQTTRQLLEATKALIGEKGCHVITMKDIMERSE